MWRTGESVRYNVAMDLPEPYYDRDGIILCVLDPFSGSGTTLDVCRNWGRRAIGIDVRKSQCEIAKQRLAQLMLPFGD